MKVIERCVSEKDDSEEWLLMSIEERQHTIKPMEWIPVSERLPKEGKQVLVCNDFGDIYIAEYETFSDGEGRWCESVGYRCLYGIVAWMPLPEPWRGEEDE